MIALPMLMRRSIAIELLAVGAAAIAFVATFRVRPPYVDFALGAAAVVLIVASAPRSRRLWRGLRTPAGDAWPTVGAFTVLALLMLAGIGALTAAHNGDAFADRLLDWHMLAALLLYFPWALLQQYIFQYYLLGRLLQLAPVAVAIGVTACAFASVHFPRWPVMIATIVAGAVWSASYYRTRQLLPLATSHALLGAALHYWVFGNDLLERWLP
jgi:membrane protease YdiL (CAAX protease family)